MNKSKLELADIFRWVENQKAQTDKRIHAFTHVPFNAACRLPDKVNMVKAMTNLSNSCTRMTVLLLMPGAV